MFIWEPNKEEAAGEYKRLYLSTKELVAISPER
jgi:hypothetical protein